MIEGLGVMISVAMTTYNGEKYIREQLESIFYQTKKVDEIIVVDDCSTDATVKIINEIKETFFDNIKIYVNDYNLGYIDNFKKAISKCKGDYIFLSDQDDIWYNDKVEKCLNLMKENQIELISTQFELINSNGEKIDKAKYYSSAKQIEKKLSKITFDRLLYGNILQGCTYCFTKKIQKYYLRNSKNDKGKIIHDYSLTLIAAMLDSYYVYNEPLIYYRLHSNNSIGMRKEKDKIRFKIRKKINLRPDLLYFLDRYQDLMTIRMKIKSRLVLYLRVPIIKEIINNTFRG